jgi:hypothetical protein
VRSSRRGRGKAPSDRLGEPRRGAGPRLEDYAGQPAPYLQVVVAGQAVELALQDLA